MITQTGVAVFQNNLLNDNTTIRAIFPKTESEITYTVLGEDDNQEGINKTKLNIILGYKISITANLKIIFPKKNVIDINSTLGEEVEYLFDILKNKKEFYYIPSIYKRDGVYKIIEDDIVANLAYKVKHYGEISPENYVMFLEESGQEFSISMKTTNLIDIYNIVTHLGYGREGYAARRYGT